MRAEERPGLPIAWARDIGTMAVKVSGFQHHARMTTLTAEAALVHGLQQGYFPLTCIILRMIFLLVIMICGPWH